MALIYSLDFEGGDLSEFDSTTGTGTLSASASAARTGSYGFEIAGAGTGYGRMNVTENVFYTKFDWQAVGGFSSNERIIAVKDGSGNNMFQLIIDANQFYHNVGGGGTNGYDGAVVTGQWYTIEVYVNYTIGEYEYWVDDVSFDSQSGLTFIGAVGRVYYGSEFAYDAAEGAYFDNIAADDSERVPDSAFNIVTLGKGFQDMRGGF